MKPILLIIAVLFVSFAYGAELPQGKDKSVQVSFFRARPDSSAGFSDLPWSDCRSMADFHGLGDNPTGGEGTSFKIGCTDENLYLFVKCEKHDFVSASKSDDKPLWEKDSVEFFISPPGSAQYWQFLAGEKNSRLAFLCSDDDKTAVSAEAWNAYVTKKDSSYSVLFVIPWTMFNTLPVRGDKWTGNVCRNFSSGQKSISWACCDIFFHEPWNFGQFIFSSAVVNPEFSKMFEKIKDKERAQKIIELRKLIADNCKKISVLEEDRCELTHGGDKSCMASALSSELASIKNPSVEELNRIYLKSSESLRELLVDLIFMR